jgi:hypothetical protein
LFVGRVLITLGIINGGLGFLLAANTKVGQTVYAVVAAIFYAVYIVSIIISERRRAKTVALPPKYEVSPGTQSPRDEYYGQSTTEQHRDIAMERFPTPNRRNSSRDGYTRQSISRGT